VTHVIGGGCCNDAACVSACPVNCIHPAPGEPDFATAEMLYIDPVTCIDCGACVDVCPVSAISSDFDLDPADAPFLELNAAWYAKAERATYPSTTFRLTPLAVTRPGPLRVALVGTGPTAGYVAEMLLGLRGIEVELTVFDKLLTPGGLVRFGVAPDHQATKAAANQFSQVLRRKGITVRLGVEVGVDIALEDLAATHHAVVVATGASEGRRLGLPGEQLAGSHTAAEVVGWYNGHPDQGALTVDLTGDTAVVIGNGNVALDVARVLASDTSALARTDIADHALEALVASNIRDVVIAARRGPEHAAFTTGELLRLLQVPGIAVTTRAEELPEGPTGDPIVDHKVAVLRTLAGSSVAADHRRIELRFGRCPEEILGDGAVRAVRFADGEEIETGLVVAAVGYRSQPLAGLPFDEDDAIVPNDEGRVAGAPGIFVAGWIKRGPRGGIGTNKWCARETVTALLADYDAGLLVDPVSTAELPGAGLEAWTAIDQHERSAGRAANRPRIKLVDQREQLRVSGAAVEPQPA
jgi:ferredoxin--NADP+ reductase